MRKSRRPVAIAAGVAALAGLAALAMCRGGDEGANVANYSEEPIPWNEADANASGAEAMHLTDSNAVGFGVPTHPDGALRSIRLRDVRPAEAIDKRADSVGASGNEAEPVIRKKGRP